MIHDVNAVFPTPCPDAHAILTFSCGNPSRIASNTSRCHFSGAAPFSSGWLPHGNMSITNRHGSVAYCASFYRARFLLRASYRRVIAELLAAGASFTTKAAPMSSIDEGGGKRRRSGLWVLGSG